MYVCMYVGLRIPSSCTRSEVGAWSSVLVRRVAGQPRHLRHVRLHAPRNMRCVPPLPFFPFSLQAQVTFCFTGKFFIHGVTLPLIPAGRSCSSRQRRRLVSAGGLIYLRPLLSDYRVPGICGRVTPREHSGWSVHKWHKIVLMGLSVPLFQCFLPMEGSMHD